MLLQELWIEPSVALDVEDAPLSNATVEGIGDAARVPADAKGIRIRGQVSLRAVLCKSVSYAGTA